MMNVYVLILIIGCVIWCITTPFAIFTIFLFVKHWNDDFIQIGGDKWKPTHLCLSFIVTYTHVYGMIIVIYRFTTRNNDLNQQTNQENKYFLLFYFFFLVFVTLIAVKRRFRVFLRLKVKQILFPFCKVLWSQISISS